MAKRKNTKKSKSKSNSSKQDERNLFAFLATFLSIIGVIITLITNRKDKYVMYYTKQSLVIFIIILIAAALQKIIGLIPIIGDIINFGIAVIMIIVWVLSWVYALSGKIQTIPIISDLADKFDL